VLLSSYPTPVCYYQRREIGSQHKAPLAFRIVALHSNKPLDSTCAGVM
jgi:hypothetical protein